MTEPDTTSTMVSSASAEGPDDRTKKIPMLQ